MKKSILSLIALFSVAVVSAQSYAKQPDPSVYEVVKYQKPAVEKTEVKEQPTENKDNNAQQVKPNGDRKVETTSGDVKSSSSAVAVNEQKAPARKEK